MLSFVFYDFRAEFCSTLCSYSASSMLSVWYLVFYYCYSECHYYAKHHSIDLKYHRNNLFFMLSIVFFFNCYAEFCDNLSSYAEYVYAECLIFYCCAECYVLLMLC
jgi:hypothetical protein